MKRYISAVLVPCLLLQLFGCYSTRLISTYDLVDEERSDITLMTYQNEELELNAEDYLVKNDTLILLANNYRVPFSDIKKVTEDEIDITLTIVVISQVVFLIAIFAASASNPIGNLRLF